MNLDNVIKAIVAKNNKMAESSDPETITELKNDVMELEREVTVILSEATTPLYITSDTTVTVYELCAEPPYYKATTAEPAPDA